MVKQRILLADDHEVVRAGLKTLVGEQPDMEVIGEAGDGLTALPSAGQTARRANHFWFTEPRVKPQNKKYFALSE